VWQYWETCQILLSARQKGNYLPTNPEEHEYQLIEGSLARAKTSKEIRETSLTEIADAEEVLESAKAHIAQSRALLDGKTRPSTEGDDTTQIEK
jgi:hypothetical protein